MGARHQAFIVAKVAPYRGERPRYQCIGALHDQCCHGSLVLRAALRFITLIKQHENADVIREELRAIEFAGPDRHEGYDDIPCPFTQFLFISSWGVDLDDPAAPNSQNVFNLSATMGAADGDNNDGITVIDITDPVNATCCFIADVYSDLIAIDAEQYVSNYDEDREPLESLIRSFNAIPLLSQSVINEVWCHDNRKSSQKSQEDDPPKQNVPSLVELTLRPAIEQAIAESNPEITNLILLDPSRMSIARDMIRSQNSVSDDHAFDLSGFKLSGKQIIDLLTHGEGSEIITLKLSHNPNLKPGDLEEILQKAPRTIRQLILFDTGITEEEIVLLLDTKPQLFYHLESIIHPAFLSGFYRKKPMVPSPHFTHVMISRYALSWSVSLPYFTPNTLAQGLTDLLNPIPATEYDYNYSLDVSVTAMAAYASCSRSRTPGLAWGKRTVAYLPRYLLWGDVLHLQNGEWTLFMYYDSEKGKNRLYYAILRANKAGEEFLADENSPETKTKDILFRKDLLDVFDIRGFFKELEAEGRPAPESGVLEKLFEVFSATRYNDDQVFSFVGYEGIMEKVQQSR